MVSFLSNLSATTTNIRFSGFQTEFLWIKTTLFCSIDCPGRSWFHVINSRKGFSFLDQFLRKNGKLREGRKKKREKGHNRKRKKEKKEREKGTTKKKEKKKKKLENERNQSRYAISHQSKKCPFLPTRHNMNVHVQQQFHIHLFFQEKREREKKRKEKREKRKEKREKKRTERIVSVKLIKLKKKRVKEPPNCFSNSLQNKTTF